MSMTKEEAEKVNIANSQLVGTDGDTISVMVPRQVMTKQEAMVHAAWLCTIADPMGDAFDVILQRVRNS
jgi:hypothetical protein